MHSLNQAALGHVVAADRVRSVQRSQRAKQRHRPPPLRARAALVAGRVAHRLDAEAARRAVA
jgi:hypothetical protein